MPDDPLPQSPEPGEAADFVQHDAAAQFAGGELGALQKPVPWAC